MTRPRSVLRALILASLAGVSVGVPGAAAAGPPDSYSAAEIRGWVVDAETKQPLEGVHVVAQWILDTGIVHGYHVTPLYILETVTDAKGEYYFPPWGPKPRPTFARLDTFDPLLTFFKPGYRFINRANAVPHDNALRTSRWHAQRVLLQPFRGTLEEWARHLQLLQDRLGWGLPREEFPGHVNDYWRHFPRIVLTIVGQQRLLPDHLRAGTAPLERWGVTEDQLRALGGQRGRSE